MFLPNLSDSRAVPVLIKHIKLCFESNWSSDANPNMINLNKYNYINEILCNGNPASVT